jgi:hypothetical protein
MKDTPCKWIISARVVFSIVYVQEDMKFSLITSRSGEDSSRPGLDECYFGGSALGGLALGGLHGLQVQ